MVVKIMAFCVFTSYEYEILHLFTFGVFDFYVVLKFAA